MALDFNAFRMGQDAVGDPVAEALQRQFEALRIQTGVAQLQAFQQEQADQQAFQQDLAGSDGSPQAVSHLIMKYPKFATQLKQGWDVRDKAAQQADLTQSSSIYSAALAGKWDLAKQIAHERYDAEKAAGNVDPTYEAAIQAMDAAAGGDKDQQKAVLTLLGSHLAAVTGPDHFGQVYDTLRGGRHSVEAGGVLLDDNGDVVGRSPYFKDAAGNVYERDGTGGGDPASPGAAPAPGSPAVKRTHGYTPRARDGGDNPDNVVDNKIAALSKAVGVDPDAPMNPQQFASFAQALPATEGGPGSLAAKNNNPGAIKDGSFAKSQPGYVGAWKGYAVFKDQPSGTAAMQKLLTNRFYNNGQQSIRDIIEGKPAGQAQPTQTASASGAPPGFHLLTPGKQPTKHVLSDAEAQAKGLPPTQKYEMDDETGAVTPIPNTTGSVGGAVPGNTELSGPAYIDDLRKTNPSLANQIQGVLDTRLAYPPATARSPQAQLLRAAVLQADPTYDEQAYKRRQTTIQQYTPGHAGPGASMLSAATLINHLYDMAGAARQLPDHSTAAQNSISSWFAAQTNQPWLIKYNEGRKFVASELPKFLEGKAPTEGQVTEHYNSYSPAKGREGIQTALATDVDYLYGRYQPLLQGYRDNVGKDLNLDHYAPGQQTQAKAAALEYYRANGALPVVVSSPAQAAKLPHGALFVTHDGRVLRRN